jgi:hypothetical protein
MEWIDYYDDIIGPYEWVSGYAIDRDDDTLQ